jgi:hypothetical protein
MRGGGTVATNVIGIVLAVVIIYILYVLYNWLYATATAPGPIAIGGINMPMNNFIELGLGGVVDASGATAGSNTYVATTGLKGLTDSGQYSVSMWVYVVSSVPAGSPAPLINLFEINSGNRFASPATGKTLLYVGLNPKNAALVVRQSTTGGDSSIDNTSSSPTSTKYSVNGLVNNYNSGSTYSGNDRCDIVNGIEYQRWVLISTVANGRTLDVYIDGKLARSCVYKSGFGVGAPTATAYVGVNNKNAVKGYFSSVNFYDHALSPENVWGVYQTGPSGPMNFSAWLASFFNTSISINSTSLNSMSPCTACAAQSGQ